MSHVISVHRPGDPRQAAVSDLSKVTLCLMTPRFAHSTLVVRAKQHSPSAVVTIVFVPRNFVNILTDRKFHIIQ